jgi:TolB protein
MLRLALTAILVLPAIVSATELPAPVEERFHQDVAWSPDGKWIAFSEFLGGEYSPEKWSVWVVRPDGKERRRIAEHALYVTWSPDSRKVAYGAVREEGGGLFATSLDSGITECFTDLTHNDKLPAWSPDGSRMAFVSDRAGGSHLFVLNLADLSVGQITGDSLKDYNPQWSPQGDRLVFYREKPGGHDDIYSVGPDGADLRALTLDSALDIFPSFRPDGDVVFATAPSRDEPMRLVGVRPDGSERHYIMKPSTFFARVSPDGSRVAFISGDWPKTAIYLLTLADSQLIKIIN